MLHWIGVIIGGFFIGLIARAIMPGTQHLGFFMTAIVGIVGSLVGGGIGSLVSKPKDGSAFRPAGFLMSVLGSIITLFVYTHYIQ